MISILYTASDENVSKYNNRFVSFVCILHWIFLTRHSMDFSYHKKINKISVAVISVFSKTRVKKKKKKKKMTPKNKEAKLLKIKNNGSNFQNICWVMCVLVMYTTFFKPFLYSGYIYIYIYIYMCEIYILSSTDRLFRWIKTLQCG